MNQTVGTADSTTALTASPNPAAPNQSVTLTATVTGTSPTGTVTFMDGTTSLGTATLNAGTATLSYAFATAGTHLLTASYGGDANNNASTSAVTSLGVGSGTGPVVYYIEPDQLGTPRTLTDTAGNVVWQWDNADPFGNNAPNENPSNQGAFHFNLRFPGQYYDTETGLAYNFHRDYDPSIGRYVESDPIGLWGGVNTYAYVYGNPLAYGDPFGLYCWSSAKIAAVAGAIGGATGGAVAGLIQGLDALKEAPEAGELAPELLIVTTVVGAIRGGAAGFGAGAAQNTIGGTAAGNIAGLPGGGPGMAMGTLGGAVTDKVGGGVVGGIAGGAVGGFGDRGGMIAGAIGGAIGGIAERYLTAHNDCSCHAN